VRTVVATAKAFGKIIGELEPEAARARDARLRGALERGEAETIRQRHIPDLSAGIIDRATGGMLFVQPRIRTDAGEQLLDDVVKPGFLLATGDATVQGWLTPRSRAVWERAGGQWAVIAECDEVFRDWMERQRCPVALVRPDRYVFGLASTPAELNRLVERFGAHLFAESETCANVAELLE
jgi:3-(3-hydroxy-phenyl)propionate hydroxylase